MDMELGTIIANFINEVLMSDISEQIDQILKALDCHAAFENQSTSKYHEKTSPTFAPWSIFFIE